MQELTASPFLPLVSHSVKLLAKIRHRREIYRARYPTSPMQCSKCTSRYTHLSKVDGFMKTWRNFAYFWHYTLTSKRDVKCNGLQSLSVLYSQKRTGSSNGGVFCQLNFRTSGSFYNVPNTYSGRRLRYVAQTPIGNRCLHILATGSFPTDVHVGGLRKV